ncbi:MAG: tail fiber domain-containing protein [Fibrobacterota bacterium]|nr:tail fiber domain-containing protein [Fibrobacterota bacterium]
MGIGLTTADEKLEVAGNVNANGSVLTSDSRYKRNVATLDHALARIKAMRGVSYEWNRADFPGRGFESGFQIGFIAQEVEMVAPELVRTDADGFKSLDYSKVAPPLVEATKEQQITIEVLRGQIAELKLMLCAERPSAPVCASSP